MGMMAVLLSMLLLFSGTYFMEMIAVLLWMLLLLLLVGVVI